jgi:hypothetical protein
MSLRELAFKIFRHLWVLFGESSGSTGFLLVFGVFVLLSPGCSMVPPLPAVDLSGPGWLVTQGQAVWRSHHDQPEIAGDLLLASGPEGRFLVQFTKTPFPMVVAQRSGRTWEFRVPLEKRRYSGWGTPPARLIWLHLPELLGGAVAPKGWRWERQGQQWRAENYRTGEVLEGFLNE